MKEYVMIVKENDKLYGRYQENNRGPGFIVFLHNDMKEKKPGIVEISKLNVIDRDGKKFGFVKGTYVEPEKLNHMELTNEHLYMLSSMGYIKDLYKYNNNNIIIVKDPYVMDNTYYIAFLHNGRFRFMKKLRYMNNHVKYIRDLSHLEKELPKIGLSTQMRTSSYPIREEDMNIEKDSKIYNNLDKIIWRKITFNDPVTYCIALYKCELEHKFDEELYNEILEYNDDMNIFIRDNINIITGLEGTMEDATRIYKSLELYGLYKAN